MNKITYIWAFASEGSVAVHHAISLHEIIDDVLEEFQNMGIIEEYDLEQVGNEKFNVNWTDEEGEEQSDLIDKTPYSVIKFFTNITDTVDNRYDFYFDIKEPQE